MTLCSVGEPVSINKVTVAVDTGSLSFSGFQVLTVYTLRALMLKLNVALIIINKNGTITQN